MIINDPGRSAGLGQALGQGLGGALETLAKNKLENLNRQYQRQQFQQLFPEQADLLAMFSNQPQVQAQLIKDINKNQLAQQAMLAAQQKEQQEELNYTPQALAARGFPSKIIRSASQATPAERKIIVDTYLRQQSKPVGLGENFGNLLGFSSGRLPGLFEEGSTKSGKQAKYYGNDLANQLKSTLKNAGIYSIEDTPEYEEAEFKANPSPEASGLLSGLSKLVTRPGLYPGAVTEGIAGLPGGIASIPRGLINLASNVIAGKNAVTPYQDLPEESAQEYNDLIDSYVESGQIKPEVAQLLKSAIPQDISSILPTSTDIREKVTAPIARGLGLEKTLLPQNENEDWASSIIQEAAPSLILPVQSLAKGGLSAIKGAQALSLTKDIAKALGFSATANTIQSLIQDFTGSPALGLMGKFGFYYGAHAYPKAIEEAKNANYNYVNNSLASAPLDKKIIPVPQKLAADIDKIERNLSKMDQKSQGVKFMNDRVSAFKDSVQRTTAEKNAPRLKEARAAQQKGIKELQKAAETDIHRAELKVRLAERNINKIKEQSSKVIEQSRKKADAVIKTAQKEYNKVVDVSPGEAPQGARFVLNPARAEAKKILEAGKRESERILEQATNKYEPLLKQSKENVENIKKATDAKIKRISETKPHIKSPNYINLEDLHKLRNSQSRIYGEAESKNIADTMGEFLQATRQPLKEWSEKFDKGATWQRIQDADAIHKGLIEAGGADSFASKISKAKGLIWASRMIAGLSIPIQATLTGAAGLAAGKYGWDLLKVKPIRDVFEKVIRASADKNHVKTLSGLTKLDRLVKKYSEEQ